MKLRKKVEETLEDVSDAAEKTGDAASWVGVALIAVTAVSLLALVGAVIALGRTHASETAVVPHG